ncbi:biotin/lipoyl-containing protein [Inquilinus sp. Marseille-Q2685]|uniref:biotin/lipoyl-containing protein n=1 Tax=Inquilinus sp. Marseille-Q2685 TaxID=2866581 RepID=UPI001CE40EEF|nr:lipoyl domain-containing protein [Inquilinus sp. Marseille-Q2685]
MADIIEATTVDVLAPVQQEGTKAAVRGWLAAVGDTVREGDPLVELETDKVTVEVPAPASGMLAEILIPVGQDAAPGAVLGRIGTEAGRERSFLVPPPLAGGGREESARVRAREPATSMRLPNPPSTPAETTPSPYPPPARRGTRMGRAGEAERHPRIGPSPSSTRPSACRLRCASCWSRPGWIPPD